MLSGTLFVSHSVEEFDIVLANADTTGEEWWIGLDDSAVEGTHQWIDGTGIMS